MASKPRLSFWQIWNMSFGFLGIQFGFALQNANVSRIFETLGADVERIPILWIAAPVTGLLIQPIIGHMSDNTWNKLGRRRPYFLVGAILASVALIIMPNSPALWVAAGMLWIMDASINISMEPFRAFVGDMLPSEQRTRGFAMQSFFIGTGAVVASALPYIMTNWLNITNTAPEGQIPPSVKYSFYIGGAVFLIAVLWTVLRTKEYSPEEMAAFQEEREEKLKNKNNADEIFPASKFVKNSIIWLIIGAIMALLVYYFELEAELYILGFGLIFFGIVQVITSVLINSGNKENGFVEVINDLFKMPATMKQLAIVQFFSWFALFGMWIYTTNALTSHIYDMKIDSEIVSNFRNLNMAIADTVTNANLTERLGKINEKLDELEVDLETKETTVVSIDLVKFYLSDKIIPEKELYNILYGALEESDTSKLIAQVDSSAYSTTKNDLIDYNNKTQKKYKVSLKSETVVYFIDNYEYFTATIDNKSFEKIKLIGKLKYIQKEYNTGADWVGVSFAVYNGFAAIFAFLLIWLAKRTSRKSVHAMSLVVGGVSLALIYFIANPNLLLVNMVGVGLAWASILAMPYAILTGSLPQHKLGVFMGIFNFFIVIPQILAASILGFFVKNIADGHAIWALVLGGVSMIIAGFLTMLVNDVDDPNKKRPVRSNS